MRVRARAREGEGEGEGEGWGSQWYAAPWVILLSGRLIRCHVRPSLRKTRMNASNAGTAAKSGTHALPLQSPRSTSHGRRPAASATSGHCSGQCLGGRSELG